MQKTTRPRKSAARFDTMNAKYKTVFKRRHICRYENCIVGFGVMGLAAVESAACGGNGCSVFFSLGQLLLLSF
ncbi:MAG TPA: hypothetical protein C5S51_06130 [Methanosarcinaceae archaeon]|nr:hypothetical protein [Methanosarcinaceae archaeon]